MQKSVLSQSLGSPINLHPSLQILVLVSIHCLRISFLDASQAINARAAKLVLCLRDLRYFVRFPLTLLKTLFFIFIKLRQVKRTCYFNLTITDQIFHQSLLPKSF